MKKRPSLSRPKPNIVFLTFEQKRSYTIHTTAKMHLPVAAAKMAFIVALFPTAYSGSTIVSLYNEQNCDYTSLGAECGNIEADTCCKSRDNELFVSVGTNADKAYAYSLKDDDECGLTVGNDDNACYSSPNDVAGIMGGSAETLGPATDSGKRSGPRKKVAYADTRFYINGTHKYSLLIDSAKGREYETLQDRDAKGELSYRPWKCYSGLRVETRLMVCAIQEGCR